MPSSREGDGVGDLPGLDQAADRDAGLLGGEVDLDRLDAGPLTQLVVDAAPAVDPAAVTDADAGADADAAEQARTRA